MVRQGRSCLERVCRQRMPRAAEVDNRDQTSTTAWVARLHDSRSKHSQSSRHMPPPPVNKVSGAPPSNTLWNTVPNLSRHIEEASCNAVYGNQEMDRIHYNFAVSIVFFCNCIEQLFQNPFYVPGATSYEPRLGRRCGCRHYSKGQSPWRTVLSLWVRGPSQGTFLCYKKLPFVS